MRELVDAIIIGVYFDMVIMTTYSKKMYNIQRYTKNRTQEVIKNSAHVI